MAKIRTVKPELFRHVGLYNLEVESGLPIRIAFAGLFTACDREGRFKWCALTLKLDCLPHDILDFSRVLDALMSRDFIRKYQFDGKIYGCIPSFTDHQVINNKEKDSVFPNIADSELITYDRFEEVGLQPSKTVEESTRTPRVNNASTDLLGSPSGEGKGREGKGREVSIVEQTNSPTRKSKKEMIEQDCVVAIEYLNEKAGKNFKFVETHKELLRARFKEGYTIDDVKDVIDSKTDEWINNAEKNHFLRPATLFNREKFSNYHGLVGTKAKTNDDELDDFVKAMQGQDNQAFEGELL